MPLGIGSHRNPVILPRLAALFLLTWMARNLVLTASELPSIRPAGAIQAPGGSRQPWGDPVQQFFIRLDAAIPRSDRVLVRAEDPQDDATMAQWWGTYWLYPRAVRTVAVPTSDVGYDVVVRMDLSESQPEGWRLVIEQKSAGKQIVAYSRPRS